MTHATIAMQSVSDGKSNANKFDENYNKMDKIIENNS